MPRIHDPFTPNSVGPGSAMALRSIAKRSRRHKSVSPRPTPKESGDEEGKSRFDFCSPDFCETAVEVLPHSRRTIQARTCSIPGAQVDHKQSRLGGSHLESGTTSASKPHQPIIIPQPRVKSKHRHALAVDTRYLDEPEGERAARAVLKECFSFLTLLVERGVAPSILASTELQKPASTKKTARAMELVMGIRSATLTEGILSQIEAGSTDKWLSLVPIRPAINSGNTKNQQAVYIPKALLAHSSWKMLGDMVESILQEDAKQEAKKEGYLDITILTNDVSFFSDEKEASHKRALGAFWDRLKAKFQASKIRKLHIVLTTTGTQVLTVHEEDAEVENRALTADSDDAADATAQVEAMVRKRGIDVAQCLCAIQDHIEKCGQADFKENRSSVQFGQTTSPPVDIKFWKIDSSSIGFNSLVRTWSQGHAPRPKRILFDLPETLDGTQCSVSLDVSYKTMPFRFDSALASGLSRDMDLLSQSKLEVLQLVPIPLIDATLLYGVVMSARAGFESDIEQHHEMALLVRSLLTKLSQKDCALLVRSEGPRDTDKCLFHQNGQLFLLMVEEIPATLQGKVSPSSCILHRYACADHMLLDTGTTDAASANDDGVQNQYSELVESSLDCLACNAVNPLYLDAMRAWSNTTAMYSKSTGLKREGDSEWTDHTGVGSRAEVHAGFSDPSSADPSTVPVKPTAQKIGKQRTTKITNFGTGKLQLVGPGASLNKGRMGVSAACLENNSSSGCYSSPSSQASSEENDSFDEAK